MNNPFIFSNSSSNSSSNINENLILDILDRYHELAIMTETNNNQVLTHNQNVLEQYNNFVCMLLYNVSQSRNQSTSAFPRRTRNRQTNPLRRPTFTNPNRYFNSRVNTNFSFQPTNDSFRPENPNINLGQNFLDSLTSIPITPTSQQIERATESRVFGTILNPPNDTCPITRERFQENEMITQILQCRHCFNPDSIQTWFSSSVRCPICRFDIRNHNPLNIIHNPFFQRENNNNLNQQQNSNNDNDNYNDNDNDNDNDNEVSNMVNNTINNQTSSLVNLINQNLIPTLSNSLHPTIIQTQSGLDDSGNLNLIYQFITDTSGSSAILSLENDINNSFNNTTNINP